MVTAAGAGPDGWVANFAGGKQIREFSRRQLIHRRRSGRFWAVNNGAAENLKILCFIGFATLFTGY